MVSTDTGPLGMAATRPRIIERGQAIPIGQPVELELPGLDGIAQAPDQQNVWSVTNLLGPDVEVTDAYVLSHFSALPPFKAQQMLRANWYTGRSAPSR
jgi:hypothetical protein